MRSIIENYKKFINSENIRHLLCNYSSTSNAARHPNGPIGWIMRDEGQLDLYAGKSRQILTVKGDFLTIANNKVFICSLIQFKPSSIENFRILGKTITKEIFNEQKVLAIKKGSDLSVLGLIGPDTYVINSDGSIGRIVNPVPLQTVFDERAIFQTHDNLSLDIPAVEISKMLFKKVGI